jgi:hypothetical protein
MHCWNLLNRAGNCFDSLPIIQERKGLITGKIRYVGRLKTFSFKSKKWVHDSFYKP